MPRKATIIAEFALLALVADNDLDDTYRGRIRHGI